MRSMSTATMQTTEGPIVFELFDEDAAAAWHRAAAERAPVMV